MRDLLYHPLLRLVIGLAAFLLGLFFFGLIGHNEAPIGFTRILLGVVFAAYGALNLAIGVSRLVKKKA